jgi:transposase
LVFLDETIFSFSSYQKKSWSPKGTSLELEEKKFNMIPQALIMGVSLDKGIDLCHIVPRSVSSTEFKDFLIELSGRNEGRRIYLFLDNLKVHTCKAAQKILSSLDIVPIFNVPYSPQFNGIEYVFSQLKAAYKKILLEALVEGSNLDRVSLIRQAIGELDKGMISNCINKGISEVNC